MDFFVLICHINQLVKNPLAGIMLLLATAAAEVPMSYVRVIEPYSPSRSEPAAFFRHGARHDHLLRWAGTPGGAGGDGVLNLTQHGDTHQDSSPRTTASASTTHCSCASPRRSASLSQRTKWIEKWCRELSCAYGCAAKLWCVSI